jgi:hypothetical protein
VNLLICEFFYALIIIMSKDSFQKIGDLFNKTPNKKPPAFQWQELALKIIKDLNIPANKRNSIFKICKQFPKVMVEKAYNDTKELCQTGEKWKYFFKIVGGVK